MMAGITENIKVEIPTLTKFIFVQYSDADCRAAFASVGKLNTCLNVDSDGVLL